jgi:membrane dipeptidase
LVLTPEGGLRALRPLAAGEIWAYYKRQIKEFRELLKDGSVFLAGNTDDVIKNHAAGRVSAILTAEGGDFLEGSLDRLAEAWDDGVRSITIVHYRVNEVGDIQTEAPVHHGLSAFGVDLVQAMNAQGMLIDLAHASFETTRQATAVTTKPVMISHSHISAEPGGHPRLISADHARLIAETGGIIGAWPAGITQRTFGDFIGEIMRLIDTVGVDHVAIGTDKDANFRPVFDSYRQWPVAVALLLDRGLSEEDVTKVMGGNFLRVFAAAMAR